MSWKKSQRIFTLLVGVTVGALAGLYTLGSGVVLGRSESIGNVAGDSGTTLTGMRYFLSEDWQWPFLHVSNLNAPDGVPIAFTDSIPVWSLFAKTMGPLGLEPVTWFGLWYLAVYTFQGLFAVEALRAWGAKRTPVLIAGAVVAVSMPFFIHRVFHPALAGHFIILAAWAIAGHLRNTDRDTLNAGYQVAAVAVIVISFMIHPYFIVMTSAVIFPVAADLMQRSRWSYLRGGVWMLGVVVAVGAVAYGGGYLTSGASRAEGYGLYGMVASGPFIPQRSDLFPGGDDIVAVNGSAESYVWLGFGLVAGLIVAVVAGLKNWLTTRRVIRENQFLMLLLVCLYVYAITPVVHLRDNRSVTLLDDRLGPIPLSITMVALGLLLLAGSAYAFQAGSTLIRRWPVIPAAAVVALCVGASAMWFPFLLQSVTGQFRASGRLFWTIGYGLLVLMFVVVDRISHRELAVGIAVTVAVLQAADVGQTRVNARRFFEPRPEQVAEVVTFDALISSHESVTLPNNLACLEGAEIQRFQNVLTAASLEAKPIDNMDEPRIKTKNNVTCLDTQPVDLSPGLIGFYFGSVELADNHSSSSASLGTLCRKSTSITVCTLGWDEIDQDDVELFIPLE